ncbi:MAG: nidogen-like domain-containing protein [Planctomycetota bacterium]
MRLSTLSLVPFLVTTAVAQTLPQSKPATSYGGVQVSNLGNCAQFPVTLCVPLDNTFTVVPFLQGNPCERNDDGSAIQQLTGWSFDFYGTPFSSLWINNNGNVSFGLPFSAFSASPFPIASFPMIAPFWGDVDTRGDVGTDGAVWVREWSTMSGDAVNRLVVTWDHVGYYDSLTDKLNTFQVILTDGNDPLIGLGNNVCFCYDDMQWTTGDASNGVNGFGGVPATVGANQGNGTDFFQIGRFDQPGAAYDGPAGNPDGIDFLDGTRFCFDVSLGGANNVPPVYVNPPSMFTTTVGTQLNFQVDAIGPESGQTVTITNDAGALAHFVASATPGNPASSVCAFTPDATQLGTHIIRFTATDDGVPPAATLHTVTIFVGPAGTIGVSECGPNGVNSTGRPATMWATGSTTLSANLLTLYAADLPAQSFGYFIAGTGASVASMPGGIVGDLCLAGAVIGRFAQTPLNTGGGSTVSMGIDLTALPRPVGGAISALVGEAWGFQYFYRDGAAAHFSNAVRVTWL